MLSLAEVFVLVLTITLTHVAAQTACNGSPALCDRIFSNVSQIGSHNSAFIGLLPQDNQDLSVAAQLNAGIRFLQAQSHVNPFGTLSLYYTSCFEEDAGPIESYLATIKSWLEANPNEVLMLLLTNGDNVDVSMFDAAFTSSGIKPYVLVPASSPGVLAIDAWPTLRQLIAAGTRLVVFLGTTLPRSYPRHLPARHHSQTPSANPLLPPDYGASPSTCPYILDEFSYFFETSYDTTNPTFPRCTIDHPPGASAAGRMYIANHFLDLDIFGIHIPDNAADEQTNAATGSGSIGAQVGICEGLYAYAPKGVLVDYFEKGDTFAAQRATIRL
ncbi:hypothetical protein MMC27_003274 [Xylographa pallens]|nr:hypothetical protein [Xylographa pallens]